MTGLIGLANYTLSLMHMHENARDVGKFGRKMPTSLAISVDAWFYWNDEIVDVGSL
jgi:hypothetical protein